MVPSRLPTSPPPELTLLSGILILHKRNQSLHTVTIYQLISFNLANYHLVVCSNLSINHYKLFPTLLDLIINIFPSIIQVPPFFVLATDILSAPSFLLSAPSFLQCTPSYSTLSLPSPPPMVGGKEKACQQAADPQQLRWGPRDSHHRLTRQQKRLHQQQQDRPTGEPAASPCAGRIFELYNECVLASLWARFSVVQR